MRNILICALSQKFFLDSNPIPDFDLGKALDDYIYGHPSPLPTKNLVHELAGAPLHCYAFILDFSFTPLVKLNKEDREKDYCHGKVRHLKRKEGFMEY